MRLTASAICGTDLHFIRGTMAVMVPGTILGHEGVSIFEALGSEVRNFDFGDRVVICSTIAGGTYPPAASSFPTGMAMNKNLTIKAGNCIHRAYEPMLVEKVRMGAIHPAKILTNVEPMTNVVEAY